MCVCVYSILLVLLLNRHVLLHSLLAGAKSHLLFVKPAGLYLTTAPSTYDLSRGPCTLPLVTVVRYTGDAVLWTKRRFCSVLLEPSVSIVKPRWKNTKKCCGELSPKNGA